MGWLTLRQFVKLDKEEVATLEKNGPLSFGTLKKLLRAANQIQKELNDHFDNPDKIDRTSAVFGKEFATKPYKFGYLLPKLRKFTDEGQWLAEMAKFEAENPGKYREMTELFQWLLRPEAGLTPGGRKAKAQIRFTLKMGGAFNAIVERLEYNAAPSFEKRKYSVDLAVQFD